MALLVVVGLVATFFVDRALNGGLQPMMLGAGALLGLGTAALMSYLASRFMARTLAQLHQNAQAISEGKPPPFTLDTEDEIGQLCQKIQQMSQALAQGATTLAQERDRFEALLAGMEDAVLTLDEQMRVTLVNPAAMTLLDLRAPPSGKTLLEIVRAPALLGVARRALSGETTAADVSLVGPDPRHLQAKGTPLSSGGGAVIVMHDVTDIRRLERVRQDFVANVSHELRTPVSIIQVNAETLLDGAMEEPEQARIFLEALLRNAERLSRLIADLLDISRFEAGSQRLTVGPVDVAEVAHRTVDALHHAAQEQDITLRVDMPDGLTVMADERALDQILYNFVENAVKYMQNQGDVVLRAHPRDGAISIEVEDNGPGIGPQHRARLFERFYRVDPGRSREMGGTGLGLAIAKHLAGAMDGSVGMRAASPRGSIFWIELPAADPG